MVLFNFAEVVEGGEEKLTDEVISGGVRAVWIRIIDGVGCEEKGSLCLEGLEWDIGFRGLSLEEGITVFDEVVRQFMTGQQVGGSGGLFKDRFVA